MPITGIRIMRAFSATYASQEPRSLSTRSALENQGGDAREKTGQTVTERIYFRDIQNDDLNSEPDEEEEKFDIDFALMTGELSLLLPDLVKPLGGETEPGERDA
ncbi:MAG: hypothetical protein EXR28_13250 [Betaproteobacteria bacterium]|nr:hypothetical protein [Betaproteobacteria bacterium]